MQLRKFIHSTIAILIITLFVVAIGLTLFARSLLIFSANQILADADIAITKLDDLGFTSRTISIAHIEFIELSTQSTGSIGGLVLTYNLSELMQGQVNDIQINTLNFDQQTPQRANTILSGQGQDSSLSILASLRSLPFQSLAIQQLDVSPLPHSGPLLVTKNPREITATAISNGNSIDVRINWHNDQYTSAYFLPNTNIASQDFNAPVASGSVVIKNYGNANAMISFTISELTGSLSADLDAEINLSGINAQLSQLGLWPAAELGVSGIIHIAMTAAQVSGPSSAPYLALTGTANTHSAIEWTDSNGTSSILTLEDASPALRFQTELQSERLNFELQTQGLAMRIDTTFDSQPLQALIDIETLSIECATTARCQASVKSITHLAALATRDIDIQDLQLQSDIALGYEPSDINIRIQTGTQLSMARVSSAEISSELSVLDVVTPLDIRLQDNRILDVGGGALKLQLPAVSADDLQAFIVLQVDKLEGSTELENNAATTFSADVRLSEFGSSSTSAALPKASASLAIRENKLSSTGDIYVSGQAVLHFDTSHDIALNQGAATLTTHLFDLSTASPAVSEASNLLSLPLTLASGSLQGNATLQWEMLDQQWQYSGLAHISAKQISGYMAETTFVNVSTELTTELSTGPRLKTPAPLSLSIEQIDPGIPVNDITLSYHLDTQDSTAAITDLSARIFNGTVSTPLIDYNWRNPDVRSTLTLTRIDLARVLQLGAYEGVKATGLISGEIPLRYRAGILSVASGQLLAEAPGGSIRYNSQGATSGNANLDLVNQALSNYQYHVMDTSVSYDDNGELSLAVRLQGQNPDMNQGQRVNLNLSITDNVPALLKSLQSSRSITDALEKALETR